LIPTHGENLFSIAALSGVAAIILIAVFIRRKGKLIHPITYLPVVALMGMPYIYYFIFSNLNQVHATFYMYRMQLPTIIGGIFLYFEAIENYTQRDTD